MHASVCMFSLNWHQKNTCSLPETHILTGHLHVPADFFLSTQYSRISRLFLKIDWVKQPPPITFLPKYVFSSVCICVWVFPDKWESSVWSLSRGLQASQRLVSRLLSDMSWWDYRKRVSVLPYPPRPLMGGGDTRWNWGSLCVCVCVCEYFF